MSQEAERKVPDFSDTTLQIIASTTIRVEMTYFTTKDGTRLFYKDWGTDQPSPDLHRATTNSIAPS
ncbi:hypothetical protein AJ87_11915 [Rhizobium yanglingense]|nr:hypothetical protein AJ87_11915 [Rhizobium yanglingense]